MLSDWSNFFLGELGAAAALAGLLFVSISVNREKILAMGRMADRGLEALTVLLLVIVTASFPLIPGQPLRLLGAEILIAGIAVLAVTLSLQRAYIAQTDTTHRRRAYRMVLINRLATLLIAIAGLLLIWRNDVAGFYVLAPGILLSFIAAGLNAWVLLIEIHR